MQSVSRDFEPMAKSLQSRECLIGERNTVFAESIQAHSSKHQRSPPTRSLDVVVASPDAHLVTQLLLRPPEVNAGLRDGPLFGLVVAHVRCQFANAILKTLHPMGLNNDLE